jgi:hypothetical protein
MSTHSGYIRLEGIHTFGIAMAIFWGLFVNALNTTSFRLSDTTFVVVGWGKYVCDTRTLKCVKFPE